MISKIDKTNAIERLKLSYTEFFDSLSEDQTHALADPRK